MATREILSLDDAEFGTDAGVEVLRHEFVRAAIRQAAETLGKPVELVRYIRHLPSESETGVRVEFSLDEGEPLAGAADVTELPAALRALADLSIVAQSRAIEGDELLLRILEARNTALAEMQDGLRANFLNRNDDPVAKAELMARSAACRERVTSLTSKLLAIDQELDELNELERRHKEAFPGRIPKFASYTLEQLTALQNAPRIDPRALHRPHRQRPRVAPMARGDVVVARGEARSFPRQRQQGCDRDAHGHLEGRHVHQDVDPDLDDLRRGRAHQAGGHVTDHTTRGMVDPNVLNVVLRKQMRRQDALASVVQVVSRLCTAYTWGTSWSQGSNEIHFYEARKSQIALFTIHLNHQQRSPIHTVRRIDDDFIAVAFRGDPSHEPFRNAFLRTSKEKLP